MAKVAIAKIVTSTKRFISELQVAQKLSFLQLHDHALRSACRTLLRFKLFVVTGAAVTAVATLLCAISGGAFAAQPLPMIRESAQLSAVRGSRDRVEVQLKQQRSQKCRRRWERRKRGDGDRPSDAALGPNT